MTIAHFKEFNGVAPRVRGATTYAKVADNVDLYGRTIRPQKLDRDTGENVSSPFIRVEDNTITLDPGSVDLKLMHFKGFKVVFFRRGSTWYKKTFHADETPLETEMGFTPPVLDVSDETPDVTREDNISIRGAVVDGKQLAEPTRVSLGLAELPEGTDPIPEDVYTYHIDVYTQIDGKEVLVERSEDQVVTLAYERYRDPHLKNEDEELWQESIARGDSETWPVRNGSSDHGVISLTPYGVPEEGDWGQSDVSGNLIVRMRENARFIALGQTVSPLYIYGGLLEDGESYNDSEYGEFTWFGESSRWFYPVTYYRGINYAKPIQTDTLVYDDEVNATPNKFVGKDGVVIDRALSARDAKEVDSGVFSIYGDEPGTKGLVGTEVRFTMAKSGVPSGVRQKTAWVEGLGSGKAFTYRLYRKGEKESVTRLVAESESDGQDGLVMVDKTSVRDVDAGYSNPYTQPAAKTTYSYQVTYTREAAKEADFLDAWIEESGPSNAVSVTGLGVRTKIKRPANVGTSKWNIYRRRIGSELTTGTENYQLIETLESTDEEYLDFNPDGTEGPVMETQFLDESIPFQYGAMPSNIQGISTLHDGVIFAWRGNQLYWTDKYYPSGFSSVFEIEIPRPIVSVEPMRGAIAIVTTEGVYRGVMSGPLNMDFTLSPSEDGAIRNNARSVLNTSSGVVYLSDSGIHVYDGSASKSITDGLIGEEFFRDEINASSVILETNDRSIYAFHDQGVLIMDTRDRQVSELPDVITDKLARDKERGSIYYVDQNTNKLMELFASTESRDMAYKTGEIHFGFGGRKRIKYIEFLGTGVITVSTFFNGDSTVINQKVINMDGMERDTRIFLPNGRTFKSFELMIEGTGEVDEFKIDWERL